MKTITLTDLKHTLNCLEFNSHFLNGVRTTAMELLLI